MNNHEQIAKILRDNITFSGQTGDYVIHGAIEKILEWQRGKERDFKLLVREYFQVREDINNISPPDEWTRYTGLCDKSRDLSKRILSELERFTEAEQEELPFKD